MFTLSLLSFAATVSALAVKPTGIKLPLPLADISWTAPPSMGNITFTGPHHDVEAKIAALVPRWQSNETFYRELVNLTLPVATAEGDLSKRSNRVNQYCEQYGWNDEAVTTVSISMDNLKYVLNHYGTGACTVAPKSCGRFSCSYDSSIVMCSKFSIPNECPEINYTNLFEQMTILTRSPFLARSSRKTPFSLSRTAWRMNRVART